MEKLVAEVALDPISGRVALPLVAGQTCLCQSLEGASMVVTVQSVLLLCDPHLLTFLLLVLKTLISNFCLLIERFCTVLDGGAPGLLVLGLFPEATG